MTVSNWRRGDIASPPSDSPPTTLVLLTLFDRFLEFFFVILFHTLVVAQQVLGHVRQTGSTEILQSTFDIQFGKAVTGFAETRILIPDRAQDRYGLEACP